MSSSSADTKPETWLPMAPPRECNQCGAKLFPGDWLTRDGCCWCESEQVLM